MVGVAGKKKDGSTPNIKYFIDIFLIQEEKECENNPVIHQGT